MRSWKPDWRFPPGVSQWRVLFGVVAIMGISAIPVWGVPWWRGGISEQEQAQRDRGSVAKQKAREARLQYIQSDDMPRS